jgi:hypothetical protein
MDNDSKLAVCSFVANAPTETPRVFFMRLYRTPAAPPAGVFPCNPVMPSFAPSREARHARNTVRKGTRRADAQPLAKIAVPVDGATGVR